MYKIISLGGSIIIPSTGFDIEFLKKFRALIMARVKQGDKFILVVGGGGTCRQYQRTAKSVADLSDKELDWLGIYTTWYNAEFVRLLFGDLAYKEVIKNPNKKIKTNKPIVVAGGWKTGCSTDYDAVLLAKAYGAEEMINASNIDYVYTADPKIDKTATAIKQMDWKQFRKIIGENWIPGANLPFDPKAAKTAQKLSLRLIFVKGTDLQSLKASLTIGKVRGTIVQ